MNREETATLDVVLSCATKGKMWTAEGRLHLREGENMEEEVDSATRRAIESAGGLGDAFYDKLRKERLRSTGWILPSPGFGLRNATLTSVRYLEPKRLLAHLKIKDEKSILMVVPLSLGNRQKFLVVDSRSLVIWR